MITDAQNNETLITQYYNSVGIAAVQKHSLINDNFVKTVIYYGIVKGISLALQLWQHTGGKDITKKTADYYKDLNSFEGISKRNMVDALIPLGTNGNTTATYDIKIKQSDSLDIGNDKTKALQNLKAIREKEFFSKKDDKSQSMWANDKDFLSKNFQNASGLEKYDTLIAYVQSKIIAYISGEKLIVPDDPAILPASLSKISDTAEENWQQYHSYDEMSQDMKDSLVNVLKTQLSKLSATSSTPLIKDALFPVPNMPIDLHNQNITSDYLEKTGYAVNKDALRGANSNGKSPSVILLKKGIKTLDKNGNDVYNFATSPNNPYSSYFEKILQDADIKNSGAYRFFFEKLHGKKWDGSGFYKRNPITPGKTYTDMENRMVFPAYIDSFNDAYDLSWSEYSFYGRGENFWNYKSTTRSLTLSFFMLSDFSSNMLKEVAARSGKTTPILGGSSPAEVQKTLNNFFIDWGSGAYDSPKVQNINGANTLVGWIPGQYSGTSEQMWARMTFLAQCCYPWFRRDGKLKEQPLIRVRIADFIDLILKIKSLNFDEYEDFNMDLNQGTAVGAFPMGVHCSMTADVIHADEPSSNYNEFYWRKDFDSKTSAEKNVQKLESMGEIGKPPTAVMSDTISQYTKDMAQADKKDPNAVTANTASPATTNTSTVNLKAPTAPTPKGMDQGSNSGGVLSNGENELLAKAKKDYLSKLDQKTSSAQTVADIILGPTTTTNEKPNANNLIKTEGIATDKIQRQK